MQVLLITQIILVIGLVAVILVQKTSSDGFTGASSPSAFLTGRAQANLFTRITSVLATLFLLNSLVLAYMASHSERGVGIIDKLKGEKTTQESPKGSKKLLEKKSKIEKEEKTTGLESKDFKKEIEKSPEEKVAKDSDKKLDKEESSVPISE